jgi:hypothetical protein
MRTAIIAMLLAFASTASAQVTLQPGQTAMCAASAPSATATPAATPTPQPMVAFQNIVMPIPPNPPGSSQWPFWTVQPANSDGSSAVVAYVNVTINGVLQPSYKGGHTGHTFDYRLGGQPIPGVVAGNGTFNWIVGPSGTYNFTFSAYNDAGQLLQSVPKQISAP